MITLLIILILLLIGSGFVIWNLLNKVEIYEDDIQLKEEYIVKIGELADDSYKKIKDLDIKGAFEADDEVGVFFENLKAIALHVKSYTQNYSK